MTWPNKCPTANHRPAGQSDGSGNVATSKAFGVPADAAQCGTAVAKLGRKGNMKDEWQEKPEAIPPKKRLHRLPVYYRAELLKRTWKMQLVFTVAGALLFLADYFFYRAGRTPEFLWARSLMHALIPVLIIPSICVLIVVFSIGVSLNRGRRHDKKP